MDKIEVHRWPVAEIAPLMLGAPGSEVKLGFRRKVAGTASPHSAGEAHSNTNGDMQVVYEHVYTYVHVYTCTYICVNI